MKQTIAHIALIVNDYDEAISFFTKKMDFVLVEDSVLSPQKRWVIVAPPGTTGCSLLLARAANEEQQRSVGNQSGGRVFLFLHTDDFMRDYKKMQEREIQFIDGPRQEEYGWVAVFVDLYGNKWDLVETTGKST